MSFTKPADRVARIRELIPQYDFFVMDSSSLGFLGYLDFLSRLGWGSVERVNESLDKIRAEIELGRILAETFVNNSSFVLPEEVRNEYAALHGKGSKIDTLRKGRSAGQNGNSGRRYAGYVLSQEVIATMRRRANALANLVEAREGVVGAMNPLEEKLGSLSYRPVLEVVHGLSQGYLRGNPWLAEKVLEGISEEPCADEHIFSKILTLTSLGRVAFVQNDDDHLFLFGLTGTRRERVTETGVPVNYKNLSVYVVNRKGFVELSDLPFQRFYEIVRRRN